MYAFGNGEIGCLYDHSAGPYETLADAVSAASELLDLSGDERATLAEDGAVYFKGERRHEVGASVVEVFEVDADWGKQS